MGSPVSSRRSTPWGVVSVSQPGTGSLHGIPFDRCTAVLEYDARLGTLPAAQGWTHVGGGSPSDYVLIDGGVVSITTTADSYWEKEVTLSTPGAAVHLFSKHRVQSSTTLTGDGLELRGEVTPGAFGNYEGIRYVQKPLQIDTRRLDGVSQTLAAYRTSQAWTQLFAGEAVGAVAFSFLENGPMLPIAPSIVWAGDPGGGLLPSVRARFGDFGNSTLLAQLRNFVVSTPGRFMRAFFRSYAAVASPVLRLYFMSDLDGSNSARIKVRYGSLSSGSDPYSYGGLSASVTSFFVAKNAMVEATLSLPSLTAMAPFWFSVERDWANVDDATAATIHLVSATVRSS